MIKPSSKKPSKEFINYLKDTPILPLTRLEPTKQSIEPFGQKSRSSNYPSLIEGDFSKISTSYVLEDDRLRKKSILYNKSCPTQLRNEKQEQGSIQDIEMIKEIAKLEYLEQKGYLKPEQAAKLQQLRGPSQKITKPMICEAQKAKGKIEKYAEIPYEDSENMNPNICYQQMLSPNQKCQFYKMDPKMNPQTDPYYQMHPQTDPYYQMEPYQQMNQTYPYQQTGYFQGPEQFSHKAPQKNSQPEHPYYIQQQSSKHYPVYH